MNSYDTAGRATSASTVVPTVTGLIPAQLAGTYTTTTSYNPDGSTATVGLPATGPVPAETLAYTYTATNLPNATTGTPTGGTAYPYANSTVYTPLGEVQWLKLGVAPYNSQLRYDYDLSTRRLVTASHYLNTTLTEQTSYTYSNSGLITSQTTQPQSGSADTQCYNYDYQQQLTQAWTPSNNDCTATPTQAGLGGPAPYWNSWTTDTTGKTSQKVERTTGTSATTNYTYNADGSAQPHFVTATSGTNGDQSYTADAVGNTISRPNAGNTQTLAWNDEGKLATITTSGTTVQTNLYNATGTRVIRAETGRTTLYVAGTELTYTTNTGVLTANRSYTHTGQAIAHRTGAANSTVTTLIPDRQGTTHQQVNTTNGTITTTWQAPYGQTRTNPSSWVGERGFVGGNNDTTTGLVHIAARDYDTTLNRFITTDPIHNLTDPLNYNPYTYANNNPTTNTDPTGLVMLIDGIGPLAYIIGLEQRNTTPKNDAPQTVSPKPVTYTYVQPAKSPIQSVFDTVGGALNDAGKAVSNVASQAVDYVANNAPQIAITVGVVVAGVAVCAVTAVVGCIVGGVVLSVTAGYLTAQVEGREYGLVEAGTDALFGLAGGVLGAGIGRAIGAATTKILAAGATKTVAEGAGSAARTVAKSAGSATNTGEEMVSLYKASQRGLGEEHFVNGYKPESFPGNGAYFAKEREIAESYAIHYGEGVIETRIPRSTYDQHFAQYEMKYLGSPPGTELAIPGADLNRLSQFERVWHR